MPVDPSLPPPITSEARLADRLSQIERRVAALEQREGLLVVAILPSAGREGRLVKLSGGGVYVDTGSSWVAL